MIRKRKQKPAKSGAAIYRKEVTPTSQFPDVILDFVFEDGLLSVEIRNIGNEPALDVKTKFSKRFTGLGGECEMSQLAMFRNIAFLAPARSIRTFLASSDSYFRRKQPMQIDATLQWRDREGKRYSVILHHDLSIYSDIIILHHKQNPIIPEE